MSWMIATSCLVVSSLAYVESLNWRPYSARNGFTMKTPSDHSWWARLVLSACQNPPSVVRGYVLSRSRIFFAAMANLDSMLSGRLLVILHRETGEHAVEVVEALADVAVAVDEPVDPGLDVAQVPGVARALVDQVLAVEVQP